jgi:hypothetical protein
MHEMVTRFEQILYDELLLMMISYEESIRPPSRQSLSNSSTGSHADLEAESDSESDVDEEAVRAELVKFNNPLERPDKELNDSSQFLTKDEPNLTTSDTPSVLVDTHPVT